MAIYGLRRAMRDYRSSAAHEQLQTLARRIGGEPSVYFFALHRGGSTLLTQSLDLATNLHPVDYGSLFWKGLEPKMRFYRRGHLYGAVRLSWHLEPYIQDFRASDGLDIPKQPGFMRGKNAVVMIRDPRDIIVSRYHFFGWHHPFSAVPQLREAQSRQMAKIQQQSIDEFALEDVAEQLRSFDEVTRILDEAKVSVLLKYEEMIQNFSSFSENLTELLKFSDETLQWLYEQSRPRTSEVASDHKRSGRFGGYIDHLKPETLETLDSQLGPILDQFGYPRSYDVKGAM